MIEWHFGRRLKCLFLKTVRRLHQKDLALKRAVWAEFRRRKTTLKVLAYTAVFLVLAFTRSPYSIAKYWSMPEYLLGRCQNNMALRHHARVERYAGLGLPDVVLDAAVANSTEYYATEFFINCLGRYKKEGETVESYFTALKPGVIARKK